MPDMLVKLYELPPREAAVARCLAQGVTIRRPMAYEMSQVSDWIRRTFHAGWADETAVTFSRQPIGSFIATENGQIVGFSAHDATAKGFFGPTGVAESHRNRGIGQALLLSSLHALAEMGYAYAVIGSAETKAQAFYAKCVGAIEIPGSEPGIYRDWLKKP